MLGQESQQANLPAWPRMLLGFQIVKYFFKGIYTLTTSVQTEAESGFQ